MTDFTQMTNEEYLMWLQNYFGYRFKNLSLLQKALTAPGAEGDKEGTKDEKDKYEGNRKLAQMGDSLIPVIIRKKALYIEDGSRSFANDALKAVASKASHAERGTSLGINKHMRLNLRSRGVAEPNTLSLAMCAILGAVWQDCNEDPLVIRNVVECLFIGTELQFGVDPRSIYQGALSSVGEFITDGLLDNQTDVTSSYITQPSLPDSTNNPGICDIPSPETQSEGYYGSNVPLQIPITRATSSGTGIQVPVREIGNISIQPRSNADITNHEHSFYHVSDHEFEEMRWNNTSNSQVSTSPSPFNGFSRSGSSFLEIPSYDGAGLRSPSSTALQGVQETPTSDSSGLSQEVIESIESPLQSQPSSIEEIQDLHTTERAGASSSLGSGTKRKIKSASNASVIRSSKFTQLDEYILLEKARCQSFGLSSPDLGLDLVVAQASNVPPISDDNITHLKMLYYGIGSPESIVGLRDLLRTQRLLFAGKDVIPSHDLSMVERIKTIDYLNDKIACHNLVKRCHIYQLFVDVSTGSHRTSDGFVNNTMRSITTRAGPQMGNPNNLEDSQITKSLLNKLYPEVKQNTSDYINKHRYVGNLRKLGERLRLLVEKFGYGILGLLPVPADEPTGQPVLNITNNLILSIPNNMFKDFVLHLNQMQGDVLRPISEAVSEVVSAIFRGQFDPSKSFRIEELDPTEIIRYPRGSKELVRLIS